MLDSDSLPPGGSAGHYFLHNNRLSSKIQENEAKGRRVFAITYALKPYGLCSFFKIYDLCIIVYEL